MDSLKVLSDHQVQSFGKEEMQKHEIDELLKRHCQISSLELCAMHWVPEKKNVDWYLGFLQATEIHRGIRELFSKDMQPQAYEALATRIQDELLKFAANGSAQDAQKEVALAILITMIEKGISVSFLIRALADVCGSREQLEVVSLLFQAACLLEKDEV
jgi:hypothetical protein